MSHQSGREVVGNDLLVGKVDELGQAFDHDRRDDAEQIDEDEEKDDGDGWRQVQPGMGKLEDGADPQKQGQQENAQQEQPFDLTSQALFVGKDRQRGAEADVEGHLVDLVFFNFVADGTKTHP